MLQVELLQSGSATSSAPPAQPTLPQTELACRDPSCGEHGLRWPRSKETPHVITSKQNCWEHRPQNDSNPKARGDEFADKHFVTIIADFSAARSLRCFTAQQIAEKCLLARGTHTLMLFTCSGHAQLHFQGSLLSLQWTEAPTKLSLPKHPMLQPV